MKLTSKHGRLIVLTAATCAALALLLILWWRSGAERREAISILSSFEKLLNGKSDEILKIMVLPPVISPKSGREQANWAREVLKDELSQAGIAAIGKDGIFGSLKEIFPEEADTWSGSAGVSVHECVAFKMERSGIRAEVVLYRSPAGLRIVRCNNVKQMAPRTP